MIKRNEALSNQSISKERLKSLIEPHLVKNLDLDVYEIQNIDPVSLMTHNRLDLAFKLIYLDMYECNSVYAKKLYADHIRAFTLGEYIEPGSKTKDSIEKYLKDFDKLYTDIMEDGFNCEKSIIPLSKNRTLLNGSHRVACAIAADKNVQYVEINCEDYIYNDEFFLKRGVSQRYVEAAVTKYIEISSNVYIALIWPSAVGKDNELEKIFTNVIYKKKIKLNKNGAHNLLSQVYHGEQWLGSIDDNYKGVGGKQAECFQNNNHLRVVAFQASSFDEVCNIKENIRNIFNIGKHSIHISDSNEEAIRITRLVFNENSLHFINIARPNKYLSTHAKIKIFKEFLNNNNLDNNKIVIDTGMTLSLYGLRETADIDYLSDNVINADANIKAIECHDDQIIYHDVRKKDLIYDPMYYYYFEDIKYIAFNQIYKMKQKRRDVKDLNDIMMMEGLLENNYFKEYYSRVKQYIYYNKIKIEKRIGKLLKKIGMFHLIRNIYYKILRK